MLHGINPNVVHGWRKLARGNGGAAIVPREFVPVRLEAAPGQSAEGRSIEVELRRGAVTMKIIWPQSETADFTAWTRELLR